MVHVPWGLVLYRTVVPSFSLSTDYVVTVVAVLGTTITPYCFFWQSSEEAEEEEIDPAAHQKIGKRLVLEVGRGRHVAKVEKRIVGAPNKAARVGEGDRL